MAHRDGHLEDILEHIALTPVTRRNFLKWMGTSSVLALISSMPLIGQKLRTISEVEAQEHLASEPDWIYTACNMCGGQSGIKVYIENGAVRKIEPSEFNPIGVANISTDFEVERARGARMCPKGNSAVKSLYDPDRLKTPMIRTGPRGSNRWRPITWDEAIAETARQLDRIRAQYGPQALAWFSEDHSFVNIQQDFCDLFGTPNYHNHSNLCDVSRKRAFSLVMGDERPLADFQNTQYMLLFGWNPLSATKWSHLPAIINRGREKGARMVVVDPVYTHTAAKADEWIPIRPGTDGAMALAMAQVLIKERLYDEAFVSRWTVGFPQFARYVADKTPEWAERITSVPAATIRRLARELAANRPAVIDFWSGPGHHTNATQGGRAIALLATLLGQYDIPGTMLIPNRKGPKRRSLSFPKPAAPRIDGRGTKYPFAHGSGVYVEAREAIIAQQPYPVKAGVFVFQNFVMAVPNTARNLQMFSPLEFVLCVDTHMSETALMADIVVPGSNFLERYDLTSNWVTFQSVSLRQPVVPSWINGMTEAEFVIALGRALGLRDANGIGFGDPLTTPRQFYEQYLSDELKGGIGITLDELKSMPGAVWIGEGTLYRKYETEMPFPTEGSVDPTTGVVKDASGKPVGVMMPENKVRKGFNTPSRKIEFYSAQLEAKGFDPLPAYTPPIDGPASSYPLALVNWKQTEHTHTRTFNNVWLMEMKGDNPLWMHPETASRLGLEDGDEIVIESPIATASATLKVTPGIHPEVVGLHHGYGHWGLGPVARGQGVADGQFCPGRAEILSGQAITKETPVRVRKLRSRQQRASLESNEGGKEG